MSFLAMKMISASMSVLILCSVILIGNGLGFNIRNKFNENGSDILNDKRQLVTNIYGSNSGYTKDNNYVYYMGQKITGASVISFQVLGDGYAKDSSDVYYFCQKIPGAFGRSFQVLGNGYGKDSIDVYYLGQKVAGASGASFQLFSRWL